MALDGYLSCSTSPSCRRRFSFDPLEWMVWTQNKKRLWRWNSVLSAYATYLAHGNSCFAKDGNGCGLLSDLANAFELGENHGGFCDVSRRLGQESMT